MLGLIDVLVGLSVIFVFLLLKTMKRPSNFPPGPRFMPFVGNSVQLRREAQRLDGQHLVFEKWGKEFNTDILGLKLGSEFVVVVRGFDLVHKAQVDDAFDGRPDNFFFRLRTMGKRNGITFTDGQLWYENRNLVTKQLRNIGYGRSPMEQRIEGEAKSIVEYIDSRSERPLWPGSFLAVNVLSVLWHFVANKRFEHDDEQLNRLIGLLRRRSKFFDMYAGPLTHFPWLRFLMPEKTGYNLIRQLNEEFHAFFMETINEHKRSLHTAEEKPDLIYSYLREMELVKSDEKKREFFNETQLIMVILDLFIAGSHTTSNTVDLAIMTMAMNPDIQKKVYEEIEFYTKSNSIEFPTLASRNEYQYTNAFLMEIDRFFHILPITGPRRTLYGTKLAGFDIPRDATILTDSYSVHTQKDYWGDAEMFRPERFLDEQGNTRKDEHLMPFGVGKRRCLGDALGRAAIFAFVTRIVKNFEIVTCAEGKPTLKLTRGIILSTQPYKVEFIRRNAKIV